MPWKKEKIGEGEEVKEVIVKGEDGNPIFVNDDSTEMGVDWSEAMKKVKNLIDGEKKWRNKSEETEKGYTTFREKYKDIENPEEAFKALETVKNLGNKKLIDAGKAAEVEAQIKKVYEEKTTTLEQKVKEGKEILEKSLTEKDNIIYKLTVSNKFASSEFLKEKTVLGNTPDIAEKVFGEYFKVEDGKPVGYHMSGEDKGKQIYSTKKAGDLAPFEEAIQILIDEYPGKGHILKGTQQSGSGSQGAEDATGGKVYKTTADIGSDAEKAAYISKHGLTAYQKLVDAGSNRK